MEQNIGPGQVKIPKRCLERYAMMEMEVLAIYFGIKQWHLYLSWLQQFEVIIDHQPLKTISNKKDVFKIDNEKMMRITQEPQIKCVLM